MTVDGVDKIRNKRLQLRVASNRSFCLLYVMVAPATLTSFVGEIILLFDSTPSLNGTIEAKVGILLFATGLFGALVLASTVFLRVKQLENLNDQRILLCTAFSAPLLVVRLLYHNPFVLYILFLFSYHGSHPSYMIPSFQSV